MAAIVFAVFIAAILLAFLPIAIAIENTPICGVLLDCFGNSGTMLLAGLDFGASKVIGIEQEEKYIKIAEKRIVEGLL